MENQIIISKLNSIEEQLNNQKVEGYINLIELKKLSSLSASSIYRSIKSGRLKGKKSSPKGKWIFSMENVRRWLNG